jgi:hypothetical protein
MMGDARKTVCLVASAAYILYDFCTTIFIKQQDYYGTQIRALTNGNVF